MAAATLALPAAIDQTKAVNPWLIAITVTLATFMELLDTAIANVSLPHIAGGLATSYDEATWVLTSYLVANAVVLPLSAWLSRVFGRKNYYMACVALFSLSSLMCGLAPSLGLLIFFRVLQGIAGGGLAPVEQAILVDTFPASKRAAAFALCHLFSGRGAFMEFGAMLGTIMVANVFFVIIPGQRAMVRAKREGRDPDSRAGLRGQPFDIAADIRQVLDGGLVHGMLPVIYLDHGREE